MFQQLTPYIDFILVIGGLLALFAGGEALIRGAVALADRLNLPKLLIGLVVVGFGTSVPELMVSIRAVSEGTPDIAVGNVIGSDIANILLVAAAGALLRPISTAIPGLKRDTAVMLAAGVALCVLSVTEGITQRAALAMLAVLAVYMAAVYMMDRRRAAAAVRIQVDIPVMALPWTLVWLACGLALLVLGADWLVEGASHVARAAGVSEAVIGLSVVAVGTSLPELTVSIVGALKGQNDVSLGNVIGSNIFNILAVLGITALIHPFAISPSFRGIDLPLMMGAMVFAGLVIFFLPKFGRLSALCCLSVYGIYMMSLGGALDEWCVTVQTLLHQLRAGIQR